VVMTELDCFPIHDPVQSGTEIANMHSIKIGTNLIEAGMHQYTHRQPC